MPLYEVVYNLWLQSIGYGAPEPKTNAQKIFVATWTGVMLPISTVFGNIFNDLIHEIIPEDDVGGHVGLLGGA